MSRPFLYPFSLWEKVRMRAAIIMLQPSPHPAPLPRGEGEEIENGGSQKSPFFYIILL